MSKEIQTDVVVLGGGPGGYTAAFRAADLGLSVCLVEEKDTLGGVCLNVGCIPSKTLLHAATVIEEAQHAAEIGIQFQEPEINHEALRSHKTGIINQLTTGLDKLCKARMITRVTGRGRLTSTATLTVDDSENTIINFKNGIIATGSRPVSLPGFPKDPRIWNSTDALALRSIPKRLLIIGGGIIGLEMAQVYYALGSEITIVETQSQIIPSADKDVVQPLFLKLKKQYQILTKTMVKSLTLQEDTVIVELEGGPKVPKQVECDAVLVAVGRKPNSEEMGLDIADIKVDDRGFITVNEEQKTSVPTFFAIGDITGDPMLAHKATHQGKVAAEVIAGHKSAFLPMTIPAVAYTNPEVAWAGLTEKEAKEKKIKYKKGKFPWGASGRALSSGAATGVSKVLFDEETKRIIGAAICGLNAGEIIHEAVLAIEMGADAEDISKTVHAHPTLAETFAFAAEIVDGSITDILPNKK